MSKWIKNTISLPLKAGRYTVLAEIDELGTLQEFEDNWFNGKIWVNENSMAQFIMYWKSYEDEEYRAVSDSYELKLDQYMKDAEVERKRLNEIIV